MEDHFSDRVANAPATKICLLGKALISEKSDALERRFFRNRFHWRPTDSSVRWSARNGFGRELLDLDGTACRFDFLLDVFGFFLGHAFFQRLWSAFDECLGFGEA